DQVNRGRGVKQHRESMGNIMDYCDRHKEGGRTNKDTGKKEYKYNAEADRALKVREVAGGYDFSEKVEKHTLPADRSLTTRSLDGRQGQWYSDSGIDADRVGIANKNREFQRVKTSGKVEVLSGKACATRDTWTQYGKPHHEVRGGGQQYYVSYDQKER